MNVKKINYKAIETYSHRMANVVASSIFKGGKLRLEGKELISITSLRQLNLFVLKNILDEWHKETDALKSDFFDYNAPQVKEALKEFMQKLSFNISINQETFMTLFSESCLELFQMILEPEKYFLQYLSKKSNEQLKEELKYFVWNKSFVEKVLADPNFSPENVTNYYIDNLKAEIPFASDVDFFDQITTILPASQSDFVIIKDEDENIKPVVDRIPILQESEHQDKDHTIKDKFTDKLKSVNTLFSSKEKPTLLDQLHKVKTSNKKFKDCISLNQKYVFIKELFGSDLNAYDSTVEKIDSFESYETASNFLIDNFAGKYSWTGKEEISQELFECLALKY